jgi:hypothetical protein
MLRCLLLCACLLAVAGCSNTERGAAEPAPADSGLLPPFPVDRVTSDITTHRNGQNTYARSPGCQAVAHMDGPALRIPGATAPPLEWATYQFYCAGNDPLQLTLQFGFDSYPASDGWVAVANFTTGNWELHGPYTYDVMLELTAEHRSPLGNAFVSVIGFGAVDSYVWWLELKTTGTDQPPVASIAMPGSTRIAGS